MSPRHRIFTVALAMLGAASAARGAGPTAPAAPAAPVAYNTYWGDLHGHTMESPVTLTTGTIDNYIRYARDTKGLNFVALTEKDFDLSDSEWADCKSRAAAFTSSSFVAFSAFEWGDDTYGDFGHRPVYYLTDTQPLFRSSSPAADHVSELLEGVVSGTNGFTGVAHPDLSNYLTDWAYFDGASDKVAEVYSRHGHFETGTQGCQQALAAGLRFGFSAVSDTRTAQPGDYGLTAVLATSLSKSNLHGAIKARRCYATSGAKILLRVLADGHEMGEVYTASTGPTFTVNCTPPGSLSTIEILKNNSIVYTFVPAAFMKPAAAGPWHVAPAGVVEWASASVEDRSWDTATLEAVALPGKRTGPVRLRRRVSLNTTAATVYPNLRGDYKLFVNGTLVVDTRALQFDDAARPHDCNAPDAHEVVGSREWSSRLGFYDLTALGVTLQPGENTIALELDGGTGQPAEADVQIRGNSIAGVPVSFTWADNAFTGPAFYYVRVTQTDGHQAWGSPIWVDRLAPDTTPPRAPLKLRASRDANDVYLSWSKVTKDIAGNLETVQMYRVFRGTTPDFVPDRTTFTNQIATTTKSTYRDLGGLVSGVNYYYRVATVDAANNQSPACSNLAFKTQRTLPFHTGISNLYWLSIPYQAVYSNASGFARDLNGNTSGPCTKVLRWDVATQRPQNWVYLGNQWTGTNFPLTTGQAVGVTLRSAMDAIVCGAHDDNTPVRLTNNPGQPSLNWVSLPTHTPHQLAFQLVQDINQGFSPAFVTRIVRLNPDLQTTQTYDWNGAGWTGTNFVLLPGEAYGVEVKTTTDWLPQVLPLP